MEATTRPWTPEDSQSLKKAKKHPNNARKTSGQSGDAGEDPGSPSGWRWKLYGESGPLESLSLVREKSIS